MGINRYSNLSQAKFNPLSFQELSVLPFSQRKQHDAVTAQAEQAAIIESQRMAADEEAVSGAINNYQSKVDDYINRVDSEGFSNTAKSDIRDLVRERKDLMTTGIVGQKQAQYDRYVANMKQLDKIYEKGDIGSEVYNASKNKAVADYNQAVSKDPNASYQDVMAVKDSKFIDLANKIADVVSKNPEKLTQFGISSRNINGVTRYFDTKTDTEVTREGLITAAVQNQLKLNPDVVADLTQRQQLGLINDPNEYLKTLGDQLELTYRKNNRSSSRSSFWDQRELDSLKKELEEGTIDFEKFNHKTIQLHSNKDLNVLNNIIEGKQTVDDVAYTKNGTPGLMTSIYDAIVGNIPLTPEKFESIKGPLKTRATEVFEGLKRTGVLNDSAKINDISTLKHIVRYMSDHQVVTEQPKIAKVNITKSVEKAKDIIKNARSRVFYDPEKNKVYSYQQMVDNGFLKENDSENFKNISYVGQMAADNVYSSTINSEERTSFIAPHVITLGKTQFLVPGSESEMKSPYMQNEKSYNKNYNKLYRSADLPISFKWDNDGISTDVEIIHLSKNNKYYKGESTPYLISIRENGKTSVQYLNAEEFKNMQPDLK